MFPFDYNSRNFPSTIIVIVIENALFRNLSYKIMWRLNINNIYLITTLEIKQWIIKQGKEYRLTTNCMSSQRSNKLLNNSINSFLTIQIHSVSHSFDFPLKKKKKKMSNVALFSSHLYFLFAHSNHQQTLQAI